MRGCSIGQDPLNIEAAFERIRTSGIFAGAQAGQYVTALTGVEIALWDLAGKALGLPVYQLLGGKVRDRVRIYCDSGAREMIPGDERSKARIRQIQDMGFTAAKIDIDDADDPARFDRVNWTARTARSTTWSRRWRSRASSIPKNFDLAVDMHGALRRGTGKRVAKEVEPFKLMWLEEPVPAENIDAMRDIRPPRARRSAAARTSTCAGASARFSRSAPPTSSCRTSRSAAACWKARKIADMAHTYYVPVAPHAVTSPIGMMATAHVCAAIPNFLAQEWHWIDSLDLWRNWVKEGEIIAEGLHHAAGAARASASR